MRPPGRQRVLAERGDAEHPATRGDERSVGPACGAGMGDLRPPAALGQAR